MKTDKRRVRGVFAAIVADPYRKLVAIALAMGLWFFVNNQIVGTLPPRSVPLVPVASARTGERVLGNRLAVVLPMDRVVGKRFLDGDTPIDDVTIVLSGPRYRIDALENETLDLQVTAFATIDFGTRNDVEFTAIWADVADCVYRQNGWTLCDPDNRALAVEAANTFIRQLGTANKVDRPEAKDSRSSRVGTNRDYILQSAHSAKGRILDGLRNQVAEGRLISSDFGMFAPVEVLQVVRDTKPMRDGCAKRV